MKIKFTILVLILTLIATFTFSATDHSHKSKYVGEEKREIKSLSETDIEELKNGRGWGEQTDSDYFFDHYFYRFLFHSYCRLGLNQKSLTIVTSDLQQRNDIFSLKDNVIF